jgi:hypothetical protein
MVKFIAGPVLGTAAGYTPLQMMGVTVLGMMSSVTIFTFLGAPIKKYFITKLTGPRKVFTKKNRRVVSVWNSYGELGIALLTPLLLTPIGGTLILVAFGSKKQKIFIYMLGSAILWGAILSYSIDGLLRIPFLNQLLR